MAVYKFLPFKDVYIQANVHNIILKEALQNQFWPPYKYHIILIQSLSRKCLLEKSCLHCLRILVMSCMFKDSVVIVREIMPWILRSHWLRAILVFSWELDFSQACNFLRMLLNHKNFDFTEIPDKTNDVSFLNSPKTMILGHFLPFLPDGDFFPKNPAVTHNYIWTRKIMLSSRKK